MPSEIRVSRIRQFVECHRYAVASLAKRWDGRLHVGTWIGTAVHNLCIGGKPEAKPEDMVYDQYTRNAERADESVDKIMRAIDEFDSMHDPDYMERELDVQAVYGSTTVTGHIDALAAIGDNIVIVDLKTGRKPPAVWIQMALYGWLLKQHKGIVVDALGSLHVPRVGPRTDQRWTYEQRPFPDFQHDIAQWLWALDQVRNADYSELAGSPGQHCSYCPVDDCAIRAYPKKD